MKKLFALAAVLVVPFFTSCGLLPTDPWDPRDPKDTVNTQERLLAGTQWMLKSIESRGAVIGVSSEQYKRYTMNFNADGSSGGEAACNAYGSDYTESSGKIRFHGIVVTQAYCGDEDAVIHRHYFDALTHAERYTVTAGKLEIRASDGTKLHFVQN